MSGAVEALRDEDGQRFADIVLTVTDQTGATSVQGWMTFVVPE